MDPEQIKTHKAFDSKWYHIIELAPGVSTPGRNRLPVALTRELLRHVDVESGGADGGGARCLDIGLQEGMVTLLLERRGASQVIGYDRAFRQGRLNLVKRALDADFDLIGDMKLQDFPATLVEQQIDPFDVVVFSGVMYHMFDPLGGLAVVRGLVRNGGICLVESAVAFEDSHTMHFNNFGRFTAGGNPQPDRASKPAGEMMPGSPGCFWYVTPRCLDYMLRFLRFEPIDVVYFDVAEAVEGKPPEGRVGIACRAVADPVPEPGDEYMVASQRQTGFFAEFLDWNRVRSNAPEVGYEVSREGLVHREGGSVDVQASIDAMAELPVEPKDAELALDAKY